MTKQIHLRLTDYSMEKLSGYCGMIQNGQGCRLRGAWVSFKVTPELVEKHRAGYEEFILIGKLDREFQYPLLIDINDRGLILTEDGDESIDYDVAFYIGGWRQTFVPWENIVSITGDLDP